MKTIRAVFGAAPAVDFERFLRDLESPGDGVHPTDS